MDENRNRCRYFRHLEDDVRKHDRVVLTRNGRAAAVIMSPDDLGALEDTLEWLSDPAALKEIDRARQDVARGKVMTAEELRAKYLRR